MNIVSIYNKKQNTLEDIFVDFKYLQDSLSFTEPNTEENIITSGSESLTIDLESHTNDSIFMQAAPLQSISSDHFSEINSRLESIENRQSRQRLIIAGPFEVRTTEGVLIGTGDRFEVTIIND